jgi:hypothetical protein
MDPGPAMAGAQPQLKVSKALHVLVWLGPKPPVEGVARQGCSARAAVSKLMEIGKRQSSA